MKMKKKSTKEIIIIIAIAIVLILIAIIGYGIISKATMEVKNPVATIDIQDFGTIKVELYPDMAPNTVTNFICLANNGYYNGTTFHRTITDFMIQAGSKNGDGTGNATLNDLENNGKTDEYCIPGEMLVNGYTDNKIKLKEGVIAMARSDYTSISPNLTEESYNSANAQFFIMHKDNIQLSGMYTGFGKVIEGMDVVDKIANLEVTYKSEDYLSNDEIPKDENGNTLTADMPIDKPIINSISVETYGIDYGKPKTVEPFNYYNFLMQYYSSIYGE